MKRILLAICAVAAIAFTASAQPAPGMRAGVIPLTVNATTTGAKTAVRSVNVDKTYQVVGSTTSGTGTAVVTIEGSTSLQSWSPVTSTTLTLSTTTTAFSVNSEDRFTWLRANITSISGTGAAVGAWFGF